jgi:dCMP deaminase
MSAVTNIRRTQDDVAYLEAAFAERLNSDDPKARVVSQSGVGAVIALNGELISRSANVLPPKIKVRYELNGAVIQESERYHFIEHAERAAIFKALSQGRSLVGATMYCTRFPCSDCARAMVWVGISRLVVGSGFASEVRWLEAQRAARAILKEAGVTVRVLSHVN